MFRIMAQGRLCLLFFVLNYAHTKENGHLGEKDHPDLVFLFTIRRLTYVNIF